MKDIQRISRHGIILNGQRYWDVDFFPYVNQQVIVKEENGGVEVFFKEKLIHQSSQHQ